jgi:hypothetical protein
LEALEAAADNVNKGIDIELIIQQGWFLGLTP